MALRDIYSLFMKVSDDDVRWSMELLLCEALLMYEYAAILPGSCCCSSAVPSDRTVL